MMRVAWLAWGLAASWAGGAFAHAVKATAWPVQAVAAHIVYADGKPFAFEAYEVYVGESKTPLQVGRTDAQGRALFVPEGEGPWRLRAYAVDGHGVEMRIDRPAAIQAAAPCMATPPAATGPSRASLIVFGLSVLLAGFAVVQLWLRKKT